MKNFKRHLEDCGMILRMERSVDREHLRELLNQNHNLVYTIMKYDRKSGTGEFLDVYPIGRLYRSGNTGRTVVEPQGYIIEVRTKRELNELEETLKWGDYTWFHIL